MNESGFGRLIRAALSATMAAALMLLASPVAAQQPLGKRMMAPLVDHHIHLGSPALGAYIEAVNEADPSIFEHLSKEVFSKPRAADALHILDEAGVKRAVLLSSGYLFMPGSSFPDASAATAAADKLRAENRFIVDTALASHGRLIAFVAINPLTPNASSELSFWRGKPGVSGIKLHLGAAGFDERSPNQVTRLARFFAQARRAHLPLVVHMRGGGPYTKTEVATFIDKVLSQAGDLPVQIAHGGGYGGADSATIDALNAFGQAIRRHQPGTKNLLFDISGVVLPEDTAKALGSNDAQLEKFVAMMREIGLARFVMGSDWPAIGRIAPYYALMRRKLPVTDSEWARLCRNKARYIRGV